MNKKEIAEKDRKIAHLEHIKMDYTTLYFHVFIHVHKCTYTYLYMYFYNPKIDRNWKETPESWSGVIETQMENEIVMSKYEKK